MLAENVKTKFPVGGGLTAEQGGPHFRLASDGDQATVSPIAAGAMELRAAMELNQHPSLRPFSPSVQFCFRNGCMTMAGVLPSYFLKQLTQEAIRTLEGVESVDNRICVESSYHHDFAADGSDMDLPKSIRIVPR